VVATAAAAAAPISTVNKANQMIEGTPVLR
jgi:hypothetical protein